VKEAEESYFGGKRKGKRDRGAAGKVPVFDLLKRGGRVYTLPIPNANQSKTLMPTLESRVAPDSVMYTDNSAGYDKMNVSRFHYVHINYEKALIGELGNRSRINGTLKLLEVGESTSTQIYRHPVHALLLPTYFLRECEWRLNEENHKELYC